MSIIVVLIDPNTLLSHFTQCNSKPNINNRQQLIASRRRRVDTCPPAGHTSSRRSRCSLLPHMRVSNVMVMKCAQLWRADVACCSHLTWDERHHAPAPAAARTGSTRFAGWYVSFVAGLTKLKLSGLVIFGGDR